MEFKATHRLIGARVDLPPDTPLQYLGKREKSDISGKWMRQFITMQDERRWIHEDATVPIDTEFAPTHTLTKTVGFDIPFGLKVRRVSPPDRTDAQYETEGGRSLWLPSDCVTLIDSPLMEKYRERMEFLLAFRWMAMFGVVSLERVKERETELRSLIIDLFSELSKRHDV